VNSTCNPDSGRTVISTHRRRLQRHQEDDAVEVRRSHTTLKGGKEGEYGASVSPRTFSFNLQP